jgi:hypothetical protein
MPAGRLFRPADELEADVADRGRALDGFVAHVFRDNGAAAQCASGNMGRLPDDDFCADLDAVVEVDHVGVIETKASR